MRSYAHFSNNTIGGGGEQQALKTGNCKIERVNEKRQEMSVALPNGKCMLYF